MIWYSVVNRMNKRVKSQASFLISALDHGNGLRKKLASWLADSELRTISEVASSLWDVRNYQQKINLHDGYPIRLLGLSYCGFQKATLHSKEFLERIINYAPTVPGALEWSKHHAA